jgi:hypothetical protein
VRAVPRNGDEPVRSNREWPSDSVRNIVKQILGTSDFFSLSDGLHGGIGSWKTDWSGCLHFADTVLS